MLLSFYVKDIVCRHTHTHTLCMKEAYCIIQQRRDGDDSTTIAISELRCADIIIRCVVYVIGFDRKKEEEEKKRKFLVASHPHPLLLLK